MLQHSTSTMTSAVNDFTTLLDESFEVVAESDGMLDEAAWLALLIKVDQEDGGP